MDGGDNNPINYSDLFNFDDLSTIEKGINGITSLKKAYAEFLSGVTGEQFQRLGQQELLLAEINQQLMQSTIGLSSANKANQKALLDNLQAAEQLKQKLTQIKQARQDTTKTEQVATEATKTLTQQYAALKKAYDAAFQAGDVTKMLEIGKAARALDGDIKKMNGTLRQSKEVFTAAAGSYAALDAANKKLIADLKNMPGALDANNKAANNLKAQIFANTQQLKEFDQSINQNFRNVGNYKSALAGLGNQFSSFALGYLSIQAGFALLGKVIDNNKEVSDSFALVQQKAQLTKEEVNGLEEALKKLNTRTSLKDLVDIAGIGAKRGIAKEDLLEFTKNLDQVNLALNGQIEGGAEGTATALAKINSLFELNQKLGVPEALKRTGAALVELGQHGITTSENLADFATRTAAVSKIFKLTLPEVLGFGSAFQEAGFDAERGGTAFNKFLIALATKKDKFFAIAQLGDATLTLQKFTDLINNNATAGIQKFFAGLTSGNATATEIAERLSQLGLKAGNVAASIIGVAENQKKLTEELDRSKNAFDNSNAVLDQANIKNQTLGASVDKLGKAFTALTTSGRVETFFQRLTDSLTNFVHDLDGLTNSSSWKEFWFRLAGLGNPNVGSSFDLVNSFNDKVTGYRKTDNTLQKQVNAQSNNTGFSGLTLDQAAAFIPKFTKLRDEAEGAFIQLQLGIKNHKLKEDHPGELKEIENDYHTYSNLLQELGDVYEALQARAGKSTAGQKKSVEELTDAQLKSIPQIKARIKELTALPDSGVLGSETNKRIQALSERLKELHGSSRTAKDGFAELQAELDKLSKKLQDRVLAGQIIPENDPMVLRIKALIEKLNTAKEKYDDLLRGKSFFPLPNRAGENPDAVLNSAKPALDREQRKIDLNDKIGTNLDELDNVALKYAELNRKLAELYRDNQITKSEYDGLSLKSAGDEANEEYFLNKVILNARLQLVKAGSKQEIQLKKELANLDRVHAKEAIDNAQKVEEARIRAITDVFNTFNRTLGPVTEELGKGFGDLFKTLSQTVEQFAKDQKFTLTDAFDTASGLASAFTQLYIDGSNARIAQIQAETENELALTGNNADAKKAIQKKANAEIAAEKTKQAKASKIGAEFEIAINTASAILKTAAEVGYPAAIPLQIAIGVLGAAELGLVAARPIPKYEVGRRGGPEEFALVNERGPEAIGNSNSLRIANEGKPGIVKLGAGENVYTAQDTAHIYNDILGNQYLDSLIYGTDIVRANNQAFSDKLIHTLARTALSPQAMTEAFKTALDGRPVNETIIDENGFHEYEKKKTSRVTAQRERRKGGGRG